MAERLDNPVERFLHQVKAEADREAGLCTQAFKQLGLAQSIVPRHARVEPQRRQLYVPPPFLAKTATAEEQDELARLLDQLREVNDQNVGESVWELGLSLTLSGESRPLVEALRAWCLGYFMRRSDPSLLTPQDGMNPGVMFARLLREWDNLFGGLRAMRGSVNLFFLVPCWSSSADFLFRRTWAPLLKEGREGLALKYRKANRAAHVMAVYLLSSGWLDDTLARLTAFARANGESGRLAALAREPDDALRERLSRLAADAQEMRPFLVKNFRPEKTIVVLPGGGAVAWDWDLQYERMARVVFAPTAREARICLGGGLTTGRVVGVGLRGEFVLSCASVETGGESLPFAPRPAGLAENVYVLELLQERLLRFYDRIDFARLRRQAGADPDGALDDDALALSCRDLADEEGPEPTGLGPSRVPRRRLRTARLLTILERKLGCEVRQGKGSEVAVYRPGGRIFVLGHHGPNPEVSWPVVRRLLGRLAIPPAEWLRAVYE
jgi:hypothetical protein